MSAQKESWSRFSFQPPIPSVDSFSYGMLICDLNALAQRQRVMAPKSRQGKLPDSSLSVDIPGLRPGFFLRTKLLPPRATPALLSRPRLTERLLTNLDHSVTLVTANAGSGKTTLVADFLRIHKRDFVWYQLDHTDADPFVFLGYVTYGIRQVVPSFGQGMFSYLNEAAGELAHNPERVVDILLNEVLETIEQKLILVLDDYHHLGVETPVHALVDRLLSYLPEVLHVIIVSREAPPLALARLRAKSPAALIERTDLLFTDEETQQLFREVFDLELTTAQLSEYRERTHGWITALQLVRQVAQRSLAGNGDHPAGQPDLVDVLRQSERDIFDYFAEEVFSDESESIQRLLLQISLLERIELETCSNLFPNLNCARVLPNLVRRNVFITVAGDGQGEEYRLHPLFQSFLRRRLRSEVGRTAIAAEHQRFAKHFLQIKAWEHAVRHLLAADDYAQAAQVIAERGAEWISSGALGSLASLVDSLPADSIEAYPRALAYRGEVARLRGEYDIAASKLRRAASLLQQQNDREGEAEARHSLATLARREGDYAQAFAYLDRALELTDEGSSVTVKCGNTRGLCLVSMGQWSNAERDFRAALQAAEARNDQRYIRLITHNLGLPAMMRGDFGEALRWLRRMLRDGNEPPLPQEATAHLNMARCYLYSGNLEACEQNLDRALGRCQLFSLVAATADAFETYGNLYRERGDLDKADEYYERATRAYGEAGTNLARTELLEERALLSMTRGDLAGARAQIDKLIEARPREKDELGFQTASLARGRVMIAQREYQSAIQQLGEALKYFRGHTLYYYEAQASLALAVCDFELGLEPEMLVNLRRVIELAVRYDYEYWMKKEVTANADLFIREEVSELLPADWRLAEKEVAPPIVQTVSVPLAGNPVTDLTINLLGPVEILRDRTRPPAADAWTTRRARDIFCYIVSRRHHRASKDSIVDTFWGEADFDAVEKNFHPTVSHIRKALNSNQPLKQNFLLYRDGDYQLNTELSYRIDAEEFDACIERGDSAFRARQFEQCVEPYERAIALYRGDFMQGSYEPWVEEQRAYYRMQYLRIHETLAGLAEQQQDWTRVLQMGRNILQEDQFREDIYCLLMRAHVGLGDRKAARDQYQALCTLLKTELGVDPAPETRKLAKTLLDL